MIELLLFKSDCILHTPNVFYSILILISCAGSSTRLKYSTFQVHTVHTRICIHICTVQVHTRTYLHTYEMHNHVHTAKCEFSCQ